jgi:hypothetical protein
MIFKHTQIGYVSSGIVTLVILWIYFYFRPMDGMGIGTAIFLFIVVFWFASFPILRVTIDDDNMRVMRGFGFPRYRFSIKEIVSVQKTRVPWAYGLGVGGKLWPIKGKGLVHIISTSGRDAVEVTMKDGKVFFIGTDVPQKLEATLNKVIG